MDALSPPCRACCTGHPGVQQPEVRSQLPRRPGVSADGARVWAGTGAARRFMVPGNRERHDLGGDEKTARPVR